jgi:hypothetical protein
MRTFEEDMKAAAAYHSHNCSGIVGGAHGAALHKIQKKTSREVCAMKFLFGLIIAVASLSLASQALAQSPITCATLADVYIDQRYPDTNLNYKTRVLVSVSTSYGISRGLWKFDIPAALDPSQIQSALLHLSGSMHTGGGNAIGVCCYALNAAFGEDSATWNLLAGGNYDNATYAAGSVPAGTDWETTIDVTALLQQKLDKVRTNGILVRKQDEAVAGYQSIASRESIDAADFGAYIVISDNPVTTTIASTTTTTVIASTTTTAAKQGVISCPAVADVAIDEWKPDENLNYMERVVLATNHNIHHGIARGLFLFDIPQDLEETDVRRASICLSPCHHCGGGNGGEVGFYALKAPFDEIADTWNSLQGGSWDNGTFSQAELPGGTDWNTAVNGEPPRDVKCLDVTELMKGNLGMARDNGIMMRFMDEAQEPSTWQSLASKESTDPLDFAPYMVIHTKRCPAETAFDNDTATLDLLRRFRDGVLSKTPEGRRWTAFYYRQADVIAEMLEKSPELRFQTRAAVERLLPNIGLLVDGKEVDHRAMRRDARQLNDLFKQKSAMELQKSLRHMLE